MPGTAELVMLVEFSRSVHSKYIEQQIVVYFLVTVTYTNSLDFGLIKSTIFNNHTIQI